MKKVKIVKEFDVPDGWDGVDYRVPKYGEHYLYEGNVEVCCTELSKDRLILKRAAMPIIDIETGDKFHFIDSFDIYTKCSTDYSDLQDLCVSIDENNNVFVCSKYTYVIKVD